MEVMVVFNIDGVEIKTTARVPNINDEEGKRTMTINNAINDIKNKLNLDLREVKENIYSYAYILYL